MKITRVTAKRESGLKVKAKASPRQRVAELLKHSGSSTTFMTSAELQKLRRRG